MNVNYKYLFFGAVIVLILYIIFSPNGRENDDLVNSLQSKVKMIEKEKMLLRRSASRMSLMNQSYRDSIRIIKEKYISVQNQRDDLKRNYDKRSSNVVNMDASKQSRFFTRRYSSVPSEVDNN